MTPIDGQNPGFATYQITADTLIPRDLKLHFIPLESTYGWKSIPADVSIIPFRTVELSQYGLNSFTAKDISTFKNQLEIDADLTYRYLVAKVGYNPSDSTEFAKGLDLYVTDLGMVSATAHKYYKFICQMHLSFNKVELDECIANGKTLASTQEERFLAY